MRCALLHRDGERCVYCGARVIPRAQVGETSRGRAAATMDHVDPEGPTAPGNLVTACWQCNCRKGKRHARDWDPNAWSRAKTALAKVLDIRQGRDTARTLYPRPAIQRER